MTHHEAGLRELLQKNGRTGEEQDRLLDALKGDYAKADLPSADRAMLDYALKLTAQPQKMNAEDVEALRAEGLDDRAIHDLCAVTAYFAFVNRMADGLGVELEERWKREGEGQ